MAIASYIIIRGCVVGQTDASMGLVCGRDQASIVVVINVTESVSIALHVCVCVCAWLEWNGMECVHEWLVDVAVMQYHYCSSSRIISLL